MEFSMRRVNALLKKEMKDFYKNINVLFMCVMPIAFSIIYSELFKNIFAKVHDGKILIFNLCLGLNFALVSSFVLASIIAEEKEKKTLITLTLSGVTPAEFLAGKAILTFILSEIVNIAVFFIFKFNVKYLGIFVIISTLVVLSMMGLGAIFGIISPNQMSTGIVGMPIIMIIIFIPVFSSFNKSINKVAEFFPNYNMNLIFEKMFKGETIGMNSAYNIVVILAWIVITSVIFAVAYKKVGIGK